MCQVRFSRTVLIIIQDRDKEEVEVKLREGFEDQVCSCHPHGINEEWLTSRKHLSMIEE
jgi:hypothetical protein